MTLGAGGICFGLHGPAGKSAPACAAQAEPASSKTANPIELRLDMDFHLVDGVIQIPTGIPDRGRRLRATLAVGRA